MSREQDIIDWISRRTGCPDIFSDDAFLDPKTGLIYTTDMLVENRHFRMDYFSPEDLGWKAAAVNISDIAAMGGRPKWLLVSLALPDTLPMGWVEGFYEGLLSACEAYGAHLIGGDTVGGSSIVVNVTAVGESVAGPHAARRSEAQPGDWIIATGFHGLSRVGLLALRENQPGYPACRMAHLRPQPRLEAAMTLSALFSRYALMDSSDGLADALLKIAGASGKRLTAQFADIPIHPEVAAFCDKAADRDECLRQTVLYGGEDFELVATVPEILPEVSRHFHVIGRVEAAETAAEVGAWLVDPQGGRAPLDPGQTYQHFNAPFEGCFRHVGLD